MADVSDRLLAFESGGSLFALPISEVREVSDLGALAAVPTLPQRLVSVTNHRGDALPVVSARALLEIVNGAESWPAQLLVLGGDTDEPGILGLPVDRVVGFIPAPDALAPEAKRGATWIRARASLDGRLLLVLDAAALLARAEALVSLASRGEALLPNAPAGGPG